MIKVSLLKVDQTDWLATRIGNKDYIEKYSFSENSYEFVRLINHITYSIKLVKSAKIIYK